MATKVLVPSGALGLGFSTEAFALGCAEQPDVIAIDGGSTDSGPYYLGSGTSKYSRARTKTEWAQLMAARADLGVPLVIGTAGTCGAGSTVDWLLDITREIVAETGQHVTVCTIKSDQPASRVIQALSEGRVHPLPPSAPLTANVVQTCSNIVALAGVEQIQHALATGADIVIAGRTTDTAVLAALPIANGCHVGAAWHGAKVGECGALATTHPNAGTIMISFDDTGFEVVPMLPDGAATPRTVSAHMLYENSDPYVLYEPGGHLDVRNAVYTALDGRTVRVTGSAWVPSATYTVKLEGSGPSGFQTISHVLVRDARYVRRIDEWCDKVLADFKIKRPETDFDAVSIDFRLIGHSGTLGDLENRETDAVEVGVLVTVTAPTQSEATDIARALNPALLHLPLDEDEPLPTFAFPFSPPETERGALYTFRLNHVMALDDPLAAFTFETVRL